MTRSLCKWHTGSFSSPHAPPRHHRCGRIALWCTVPLILAQLHAARRRTIYIYSRLRNKRPDLSERPLCKAPLSLSPSLSLSLSLFLCLFSLMCVLAALRSMIMVNQTQTPAPAPFQQAASACPDPNPKENPKATATRWSRNARPDGARRGGGARVRQTQHAKTGLLSGVIKVTSPISKRFISKL